jgi:hypothetical protein
MTQAAGHKLRLRIPDTAVIENSVLKAWLFTDRQTGVLQATSRSQLSTSALLHKLQGQHAAYAVDNPHGWVAVAYFANCITRLVTAEELEELVSAGSLAGTQDNKNACYHGSISSPSMRLVALPAVAWQDQLTGVAFPADQPLSKCRILTTKQLKLCCCCAIQLSRVYVGAVPEDAADEAAVAEEGLQLLALQVSCAAAVTAATSAKPIVVLQERLQRE